MTSDEWANAAEPDPAKIQLDFVYDPDLGCIAQATHPDGRVVTASDAMEVAAFWGSASVDVSAIGELSNLQAPAWHQCHTVEDYSINPVWTPEYVWVCVTCGVKSSLTYRFESDCTEEARRHEERS